MRYGIMATPFINLPALSSSMTALSTCVKLMTVTSCLVFWKWPWRWCNSDVLVGYNSNNGFHSAPPGLRKCKSVVCVRLWVWITWVGDITTTCQWLCKLAHEENIGFYVNDLSLPHHDTEQILWSSPWTPLTFQSTLHALSVFLHMTLSILGFAIL